MKTVKVWIASLFAFSTLGTVAHAQSTPPAQKSTTTEPVIEDQAMTLLKQNQQAMRGLKSYQAECRTTLTRDIARPNKPASRYELSTLRAAKPNLMRYECWELPNPAGAVQWTQPASIPSMTYACDGNKNFEQYDKVYRRDPRIKPENLSTVLEPWVGFYSSINSVYGSATDYAKKNELREARLTGRETVDDTPCDKVYLHTVSSYNGEKVEEEATWYLSSDHLVHKCVSHVAFGDKPGITRTALLYDIKTDAVIGSHVFVYTPPPGVTNEKDMPTVALLVNGAKAPDFTALDTAKKSIKLSDYKGKVVVVDFWASWCGPCMESMPHNQTVITKLQKSGVEVVLLAVDNGEERSAFDDWIKEKGATYSALTFVHVDPKTPVSNKLYNVTGIPTQYIVDKSGVIRASFVGYGEPTDDLEKAVRAVIEKPSF